MRLCGKNPIVSSEWEASTISIFMYPEIKQLAIKRVDEYGFVIRPDLVRLTSGSVGPFYSINTVTCDSFITGTSQSRQTGKSDESEVAIFLLCRHIIILDLYRYPVDTSLIHIESRKSPTAVLFDDDTGRISIRYCEY
ncbi:hypothetical protein Tco_0513533 [Tanacetum coccineum]